ncbi:hypothetical protein VH441_07380 [Psychrobacter sp. HD31]|uniref:hypothetical protein n=1 Tax=Psychrobacter sp. HD31 TaxID=3112003 RepID=UPI003DA37F12
MGCNCIKEIPQEIVEHSNTLADFKKTPAMSAKFKDLVFPFKDGKVTTALKTDVKIKCENRKTPKTTSVRFSYCPFCGQKY